MTAQIDLEKSGSALKQAFTDNLCFQILARYRGSDVRYRMPMAVAILSVAFQEVPNWLSFPAERMFFGQTGTIALALGLIISAMLSLPLATSWFAILLFWVIAIVAILPDWTLIANHTYLAVWCIGAAILFRDWWRSDLYNTYLRLTFGLVMIAAFAQKILAGSYVDGSYLTYLSTHGTMTERMFSIMCDPGSEDPCAFIRYVSVFILLWQLAVGLLLIAGVRSLMFLMVEIGFLLGAGFYADEMNFQILNIALLCVVFRYGMPAWLLTISVGFLVIDRFTLSGIANLVGTE
jgi:hypothetical protein